MPTLKPLLKKLLRKNKITLYEINHKKNKKIKDEILNDLMRVAIIDSKDYSKKKNPLVGKSLQLVRETGLKFSNEQARAIFNERVEKHYSSYYSTKLKSTYKPNPKKLPFLETQTVKGGFLYTARIYLKSSKRSENDTKIPYKTKEGKVTFLTNATYYAKTAKYAFWSDEPINSKSVRQIIKDLLKGKDTDLINEFVLDTSNVNDVNFMMFRPVAFIYTGALRT